jgi:ATP-dependent RNA helicase DeaD
VEWILGQAPRLQKALFSATIPQEIRRIADRYLHDPVTIEIEHKTLTVPTVQQRYLIASEGQKLEALSHVLETENEPGDSGADLRQDRSRRSGGELAGAQLRG